jgi:hypothetical protein
VNQLFGAYRREGLTMPYTMEDFRREVALEYLPELTPEERLGGLTPKGVLEHVPAKEIKAYLARLQKRRAETKPARPKRRGR